MVSLLARKLEAYVRLSREDIAAIDRVSQHSVRDYAARRDIIREGDKPRAVRLILDGWAYRYKTMQDGRRQIVGFFVPGDFCDLNVYVLREMDHSIGAITNVRIADLTQEQMEALTAGHPRVLQALWWDELVNSAIQREWLLNIGQRTAYERIAHLLLELFFRLRTVGLVEGDGCFFPLTQTDLADATGLTSVHVNRTLQELRRERLIELDRKRLRIPDLARLIEAAQFNASYLHLEHEGSHLDAND